MTTIYREERLDRRAHRVLAWYTVLALLVIALLSNAMYQQWRSEVRFERDSEIEPLARYFDTLLSSTVKHVQRMQHITVEALMHPSPTPSAVALQLVQTGHPENGWALDALEQHDPGLGNIIAMQNDMDQDDRRETQAVLRLFPQQYASHSTEPQLQWSYYNSYRRPYASIYPFRTTGSLVQEAKMPDLATMFAHFLDLNRETKASFNNADGATRWREPYWDVAGSGMVVSVGAPVRTDNLLWGVVAADVRLDFLITALQQQVHEPRRALIVTSSGTVVADTRTPATSAPQPRKINELLIGNVLNVLPNVAEPVFVADKGSWIWQRSLQQSSWRLLVIEPAPAILLPLHWRLLTSIAAQSLIAGLGFFALLRFLRRRHLLRGTV